jgi:Sortilin, neurotensin receptor 3,
VAANLPTRIFGRHVSNTTFDRYDTKRAYDIIYTDDFFQTNISLILKTAGYLKTNSSNGYSFVSGHEFTFIGRAGGRMVPLSEIISNFQSDENQIVILTESKVLLISDETGTEFVKSAINVKDFQKIDDKILVLTESLSNQKTSLISYNKSTSRQSLLPLAISCSESSLHLFIGRVCYSALCTYFSPKGFGGFMIGIGNIGPHLLEDPESADAYLSRDGGHLWELIDALHGSFSFEILMHGSIILAIRNRQAMTSLLYTLDEGSTWQTLEIFEKPFHLTNLFLESQSSTSIQITGDDPIEDKEIWVIIDLAYLVRK